MPDLFNNLIGPLLQREGGYSANPADPGGETIFGITEAVARANGYAGPMALMTQAQASAIYRSVYWDKPSFGAVSAFAPRVAAELFDAGVNMGVATAADFLQRVLNVLSNAGHDYAPVLVDGNIGPVTLAALKAYLARRGGLGELVLLKAIVCLRGARYIATAEAIQNDSAFIFGWLANRVELPVINQQTASAT